MKLAVFYHHIQEAVRQTGLSLDEILQKVHAYGIEGLVYDWKEVQDPEVLYLKLQNHGLSTASLYGFYEFGLDPDGTKGYAQIDLAVKMHAKEILIIPGFIKDTELSEQERSERLYNMVKAMRTMQEYAAANGVVATIEDFDDAASPIATVDGMLWFLEQVPGLKVAYDTGNFLFSGESELEAFEKLKPYITHVHCKDRSLQVCEGEAPKITANGIALYASPVGYGCIRMKEIISLLKSIQYAGTLTIEHFGSLDYFEYIKLSAKWLKEQIN